MIQGTWMDAVITIATSDVLSAEVDLKRAYETLLIVIPTITSAQVSVQVAEKTGGTYQDVYVTEGDGSSAQLKSDLGTGAITWVTPIGGFQYIKIKTSAAQAANRTFRVCGTRT